MPKSPIALAGYDSKKLSVLYHVFVAKGYAPWFLWDATYDSVPDSLPTGQVITFSAHLFAPECQLLASRRILDRLNVDTVWIIWTDAFAVKTIPELVDLDARKEDVIAGHGCSRMSRKSLERIARDFGGDIDWDGIDIFNADYKPPS